VAVFDRERDLAGARGERCERDERAGGGAGHEGNMAVAVGGVFRTGATRTVSTTLWA
jgi:hypothetical protein